MTKMSAAQQRVVDWMRDGDRALYKCHFNPNAYGYYDRGNGGGDHGIFRRVCSRKTLETIISTGAVEWFQCSPYDHRAMLVLPKSERT